MNSRTMRSTAVIVAALSCVAFAIWAYRGVGAVWMLQAFRVCG